MFDSFFSEYNIIIALIARVSYFIENILDLPNIDIILLTTMMMATLIASCCNAGLGSHTCHLSLQIGWKKKERSS